MATRELEEYLMLLLADSNLPTGNFVASSGLESYVTHGYLSSTSAAERTSGVVAFVERSVHACARLNVSFLSRAWLLVKSISASTTDVLDALVELDDEYTSMTLNAVAMRASTTQGIALLTLYEKAFLPDVDVDDGSGTTSGLIAQIVKELKALIRDQHCAGHLAICFGILTAAIGVGLGAPFPSLLTHRKVSLVNSRAREERADAARHLFLFTHARSLLSSAVRLNIVGPYQSQRLLLHKVRPIVDRALRECTSTQEAKAKEPVNTWPLSEILIARHDQLHSRIFNS